MEKTEKNYSWVGLAIRGCYSLQHNSESTLFNIKFTLYNMQMP